MYSNYSLSHLNFCYFYPRFRKKERKRKETLYVNYSLYIIALKIKSLFKQVNTNIQIRFASKSVKLKLILAIL